MHKVLHKVTLTRFFFVFNSKAGGGFVIHKGSEFSLTTVFSIS